MKTCPHCAERVPDEATTCPTCLMALTNHQIRYTWRGLTVLALIVLGAIMAMFIAWFGFQ